MESWKPAVVRKQSSFVNRKHEVIKGYTQYNIKTKQQKENGIATWRARGPFHVGVLLYISVNASYHSPHIRFGSTANSYDTPL